MVSCGTMRATVLLIAEPPRIPPRVQEGQVLVLPSVGAVFARAAEASANASAQWPVPVGGCVRVGGAYSIVSIGAARGSSNLYNFEAVYSCDTVVWPCHSCAKNDSQTGRRLVGLARIGQFRSATTAGTPLCARWLCLLRAGS